MKNKILLLIILLSFVVINFMSVDAGLLDDIIEQGTGFSGSSTALGDELEEFIKGDVMEIVLLIGNLVFAAVTVVLGAKYIWSSAEGKSEVMESLPAFVVAVIFFYLGELLVNWLIGATSNITTARDWKTVSGYIIWIINTVVRYTAFGGILFLGLKYMFSSAEGRAQMKTNVGALILGITFVFMASTVVDYIISIGEGVLK